MLVGAALATELADSETPMSYPPPPPPPPPSGPQFYPQSPYPMPPKKQSKVLWIVLAIVGGLIVLCGLGGIIAGITADDDPKVSSEARSAVDEPNSISEESEEPEPVDTDGDGVVDEEDVDPNDANVQTEDDIDTDEDGVPDYEDFRPEDRKIQTRDDVDTDKDGVPDYKDDFPKNAAYTKDSDGDGSADQVDDFPKDDRYTTDTDGDKVADSEDAFPNDPTRSKITVAMENALESAYNYLDFGAFSRLGGRPDPCRLEEGSGPVGQELSVVLDFLSGRAHPAIDELVRRTVHLRRGGLRRQQGRAVMARIAQAGSTRRKKRTAVLPAILIVIGLIVVFGAVGASGNNDFDQTLCETDQVLYGGYEDCSDQGQGGETAAFIIGGGMIALGVLGLVIISSMGSVIDHSAPPVAPQVSTSPPPATQADELKKAADLLASGAITVEEFAVLKGCILGTTDD